MENASKALLIAAAVLIVILLIAFGIIVLKPSIGTTDSGTSVGETLVTMQQSAADGYVSSFEKTGEGGTIPEESTEIITGGDNPYYTPDTEENPQPTDPNPGSEPEDPESTDPNPGTEPEDPEPIDPNPEEPEVEEIICRHEAGWTAIRDNTAHQCNSCSATHNITWTTNANGEHECNICSTTHVPVWVSCDNGEHACIKCGYGDMEEKCEFDENDTCKICSFKCNHWTWDSSNGECVVCLKKCPHNWKAIGHSDVCMRCTNCGFESSAHTWNDCVCMNCRYSRPHSFDIVTGTCTNDSCGVTTTSINVCAQEGHKGADSTDGFYYYCYNCDIYFTRKKTH